MTTGINANIISAMLKPAKKNQLVQADPICRRDKSVILQKRTA
jgi:hypothetical protein